MSTEFYGSKFGPSLPWGRSEQQTINSLMNCIDLNFPNGTNMLVSLTWFGPQFSNENYHNLKNLKKNVDRIFWLAMVDPVCLQIEELKAIEHTLCVKQSFYLGSFDDSNYRFEFFPFATKDNLPNYTESELELKQIDYLYLCYNRKPKPHRIRLAHAIYDNSLNECGIITLGKNDQGYNVNENLQTDLHISLNEPEEEFSLPGKFQANRAFGIPYDAYTLGRLDIWQRHFLNIVSETEFRNWNNLFVTEKIFKPIAGLRPFVINGQTKLYDWLESNGFKIFNHYWPHIDLTDCTEVDIHEPIINVIKYLNTMSTDQLLKMYNSMLPDLYHNRQRFFEFAKEQKYKITHLFQ